MNFFDYIKKFLIFTLKEIYSFFLKLSLFFLIFLVFIFSAVKYFDTKSRTIKTVSNYNYIIFNAAEVPEDKIIGAEIFSDSEKYNITFSEILSGLDSIKENKNVKGVIIDLDNVQVSSAKSEELMKKFKELKTAGKKIYAFGAYVENSNYTLASVADEIVMVPSSSASFSLTGYNYSELYFKKFLDNLGVNMEVVRIGEFKSYGENYTSDTISDGLKQELTRILENRYSKFTENVSEKRKINKDTLDKEIVEGAMTSLTPFTARDKKLVDRLESYQAFMERLNVTDDNIADIYDYYSENRNAIEGKNRGNDAIAVIYAEGSILYTHDGTNSIAISPQNISEKLEKALKTKNLKGIVLRVNSPGGSALASEIIYQTLLNTGIPIYVSMADTAASGGYYISMAGDKVFADNATITGSIGVVSMLPRFYNAQNKYGITSNTISKGKYSDMYNAFTPLSEESRQKIVESMESTYKEFKARVSASRKIEEPLLESYAQGKIWLGDEAKNIKLVDGIAGLDETIRTMAKDLGLGENYRVENIYAEKDFKEFFKLLSSLIMNKLDFNSHVKAQIPNGRKLLDEYNLIEENQNRPMYYYPYGIEF